MAGSPAELSTTGSQPNKEGEKVYNSGKAQFPFFPFFYFFDFAVSILFVK
jgi:hypothetical protein